jgi:hypothetical protein
MNERGEGNSTAIVAIVVLVLVAIGLFVVFDGGGRMGGPAAHIDVQVQEKGQGQPAAPPAQPAQP